jgi:hypothetical protein
MAGAFVYVGRWTIKEGKFEEARKFMAGHAEYAEANEPRMIAFHVYFDEEGKTCSVVQLHPDAESMAFHMKVMAERIGDAVSGVIDEILVEQYFGPMPDSLSKTLAEWETPNMTVIKMPVHEAGFTRSSVQ